MSAEQTLPRDCGYLLLAAISGIVPSLHGRSDIQIGPLIGVKNENRLSHMTPHSRFHIREAALEEVQQLSGRWAVIDGNVVLFGQASEVPYLNKPRLHSRCVVFRADGVDLRDPSCLAWFEATVRQWGPVSDGVTVEIGGLDKYQTIEMKGRTYIGKPVTLTGLGEEESLRIQQTGIGRFTSEGCGVFD